MNVNIRVIISQIDWTVFIRKTYPISTPRFSANVLTNFTAWWSNRYPISDLDLSTCPVISLSFLIAEASFAPPKNAPAIERHRVTTWCDRGLNLKEEKSYTLIKSKRKCAYLYHSLTMKVFVNIYSWNSMPFSSSNIRTHIRKDRFFYIFLSFRATHYSIRI